MLNIEVGGDATLTSSCFCTNEYNFALHYKIPKTTLNPELWPCVVKAKFLTLRVREGRA